MDSLNLARLAGLNNLVASLTAARHLAPAMGSAHRAFAAALSFSRISGVTGDRDLARFGASPKVLSPAAPQGNGLAPVEGRQPKVGIRSNTTVLRPIIGRCDEVDHPEHMIVCEERTENADARWSPSTPLTCMGAQKRHRSFVLTGVVGLWRRAVRRLPVALIPAIILSRIEGSAH